MPKPISSRFGKLAFVALFVAMATVAAFKAIPKPGTNLLQGVLSPLPTLTLGNPLNYTNDASADVAKFSAVEWATNGVDLMLHRPLALAVDALEVTLAGSTNLVTATWEAYTNVAFAAGETNLAVFVDRAMLDAHAVSNMCFFAFINSGDSDGDGIDDWQERYNLKTNPYNDDTDGDGLPDGWEVAHGTDPAGADTDGDGLLDGAEAVWIEDGTGTVPWFTLQLPTTISASGQDTEVFTFEMPFATCLAGCRVTHALADVNGRVCFGSADNTNGVRSVGSARDFGQDLGLDCVSVAGYWTDLLMRTALQSSISFGTAVHGDETYFVVEYDNVGFFTGTSNHVSFQVSVPASSLDIVHVRYGSVVDARSVAVVSVGAQGGLDDGLVNVPKLPRHYGAPPEIESGTVLTYHFGAGGSPFLADTDGDGLSDAVEASLGTSPCRMDTDGDGLPDGWEVGNLLDPLSSVGEDGADGDPDDDGLSNLGEWLQGTDPMAPDTDGDWLPDGVEVGGVSEADGLPWLEFDEAEDCTLRLLSDPWEVGMATLRIPVDLSVQGVSVTNVTLASSGWVLLDRAGYVPEDFWEGDCEFGRPIDRDVLALSPCGDCDFLVCTNLLDRPTRVRLGTATHDGVGYLLAEYVNLYHGEPGRTTNSISFQVAIPTNRAMRAFVRYRDVTGSEVDGRHCGVGMQTFDGLGLHSYCYREGGRIREGLSLRFEFGTNSSPVDQDTDGDGLDDESEVLFGTKPARMDTDADGIPDGWEVEHLLDPLLSADGGGDADQDGFANLDEYLNDTDPQLPDTDGDGVNDRAEALAGSNPNDSSDNGVPPPVSGRKTLNFNIHGDYAAWEMKIEGLGPGDTRVRRISMGVPGASPTFPLDVRKGNSYKLTMKWLNSDGHDYDGLGPWYCWQAKINGLPSACSYVERSHERIPVNQVVVGDGWFVENDDGLLTDHVCQNTAEGAGNVAGELEATLHVVDFTIVSDRLRSYDECVDGNLIDSRTATVTVSPALACGGRHAITFESAPALEGTPVNDGKGTSVAFAKRGEDTWKTTPFYWYGVFPDHECYYYHNKYTVTMKVDGQTVLTRECPVHFPERNAYAVCPPPSTNGTHPSDPILYDNSTSGSFWYCKIEFVDFDRPFLGYPASAPSETNNVFSLSGQYSDEITEEEEFHLKQFRGEVPMSQGGQGDCFTTNGLKYFIARQAITNSNIATSTWIVKGSTAQLAKRNCWQVIRGAINEEIATSKRIRQNDRGFFELKAKEHVNYNAAFRYHCTYLDTYGPSPTNHVHPAYVSGGQ